MPEPEYHHPLTVPSSRSTGGAGGEYERHVGAASLATLLTGGMALLMPNIELETVIFQTRRLGWLTDDLLLEGRNRSGQRQCVALQIKSSFYVGRNNDFIQTIKAAWLDFQNTSIFDERHDRIGIIAGQTNLKSGRGLRILFDLARAASNEVDFFHRLDLRNYVSGDASNSLAVVREVLAEEDSGDPIDAVVWRFIKVLEFAVLDFETQHSTTESLIKSLLASTCAGTATLALDTWNELLALSGELAPDSRSFAWRDLPQHLRERHRTSASTERESLAVLNAASDVILRGADAKIAQTVSLKRAGVVGSVIETLADNDVVVITGEAGSGKSVVASTAFSSLSSNCLGVAFRAETLAESHVAISLGSLGSNLRHLQLLFACHPRKLLWIESAERLLEKDAGKREAFSDLIRLFTRNEGWKIIITCRDYHVETFRSVFLERAGFTSGVVAVPDLSDQEIDEVRQQLPSLTQPLSIPAIRTIARNPFYLDLAARMEWPTGTPPPANIRSFRDKVWREVVCREDEMIDGLPLERDQTMVEVALRRAKALTPYATAHDLPSRALHRLLRDSNLIADPTDHTRLAPAHDVYEDWALLRWLQRLHNSERVLTSSFFDKIEGHPAMRRAFRRWLTELLDCEPTEANQRLAEILSGPKIPDYWKDDALVAVLQSSHATAFLSLTGAELLGNDSNLQKRAVHLLRVACRKAPTNNPSSASFSFTIMIPDGPAWNTMILVVASSLESMQPSDILWLLPFAEDCLAIREISTETAAAIGEIASKLWNSVQFINDRHQEAFRERVLRIMLAVPQFFSEELNSLLESAFSTSRPSQISRILPDLIWDHFAGNDICRVFPEMTLRVVKNRFPFLYGQEKEPEISWRFTRRMDVDQVFGFGRRNSHEDYPPSAWQGPFATLLEHHPDRGLDLVVHLINYSCTTYAELDQNIIEKPSQIILRLADGKTLTQWANFRLWGSYRGASVTPNALESALMALEEWLLKKAERGDEDTLEKFVWLLTESNNVCISAVLVSVAQAFPNYIGELALPLLQCPSFFEWDYQRARHDASGQQKILMSMGMSIPKNTFFEAERLQSEKREHRKSNLSRLCLQLQSTGFRQRVWNIIDAYLLELPPLAEQHDGHRLWRLELHKMDIRNFVHFHDDATGDYLAAGNFAPDLIEFMESDLPAHEDRSLRLELFLWGMNVFNREHGDTYSPEIWREKLAEISALPIDDGDQSGVPHRSGALHIAGICLRDHWPELTDEELNWCVDAICTEIEDDPRHDRMWEMQLNAMNSMTPATTIVPLIAALDSAPQRRERVLRCLAKVVLHPSPSVSRLASQAVGAFLMPVDRSLSLSCVAALLSSCLAVAESQVEQDSVSWDQRGNRGEIESSILGENHGLIENGSSFDETELLQVDFRSYPGLGLLLQLIALLGEQPGDSVASVFFERIAGLAVSNTRNEQRRGGTALHDDEDKAGDFGFGERDAVNQALARFVLQGPEASARKIITPIRNHLHEHPKMVGEFIRKLIYAEDRLSTGERFWSIWQVFADAFVEHSLGSKVDGDFDEEGELLDNLLFQIEWNADAHHWKSFEGQAGRLADFLRSLPNSTKAITDFASLATRFSQEFLPSSLPLIYEKLIDQSSFRFLGQFLLRKLEEALSSLVYSGEPTVRSDPSLRQATMAILDLMVEAGSSTAFRIRDDFVTPLRT